MAHQINTRIQLKYDSYENWKSANTLLLAGEIAIVEVPSAVNGNETGVQNPPTILFKVGPGNFNDLDWCSAKAADVYSWAKKSETDFIDWVNTVVEHPAAPDLAPYLIKTDITTGGANGTIAVRGTDVAVKGLGSAAYTDSTAYAPANIDTGIHAVSLTGGTNNGTVKLTVDGTATDNIAVTGLGDAAYTTIADLNSTAEGYAKAVKDQLPTSADYGVLTATGKDAIKVTEGQNPEVSLTLDASGNVVLSQGASGLKATIDLSAYRLITDDENTTYGLVYDSDNKVIKLVEGGTDLEISASDFIADGMLQSVVADKDNNTLTFTWNTDGGATVTTINLTDIADIYTGKNGTTINVAVSNTNEISAEVNVKSITSTHLADDLVAAINKDDNTTYTVAATANALEFTVTPSEGSAQTVKLVAPIVDTGVMSVTEGSTNGTISVDGADVKVRGLGSAAYTDSTAYDVNGAANDVKTGVENGTIVAKKAEQDADGNVISTTYAKSADLHEITTTGSIYDVTEGANVSTGTDTGVEYLIFNCGTASTVI